MSSTDKDSGGTRGGPSPLLQPLRAMLAGVDLPERQTLLRSLLADLGGGNGPAGADQVEGIKRKYQVLEKDKAGLEDALRLARADLARSQKLLEAEKSRGEELQSVVDDQRGRLSAIEKELGEREAQLTASRAEQHKTERLYEELLLKSQRMEVTAAPDDSRVQRLEQSRVEQGKEIEGLRAQLEQLRKDKDAEIARIRAEAAKSSEQSADRGEVVLSSLWKRLAATKPPLVEGHVAPNSQAAERMVDSFIELVRFVDDFDKSMRVFLGRYTKYNPSVKLPWDAYAKGDDLVQFVQRTVAPVGGRPVGPLKMRLRLLYSWIYAAMVGCDSAVESIGSELQAHLMGPLGAGSDPNRKIRDFVKADGHLLFAQHIGELRSQRLAETYGRG